MLKIVGFNGSPRIGWNTDLMLKSALEGAKAAGAETKLIQLKSLKMIPCQSCLQCKKGPGYEGQCTIKDDVSDIVQELKTVDGIIFGTPVYFGLPSGYMHTFLERVWFSLLTYRGFAPYPKKTKTAMIYTMNAPADKTKMMNYDIMMNNIGRFNEMVFRDKCQTLCAYDTMQVKDYSKYRLDWFNAEQKYKSRKEVFPEDLKKAYELGFNLASQQKQK